MHDVFRLMFLPEVKWSPSSVNIFGVHTIFLLILLAIAASPLYCIGYLYCISFLYIIVNNDILQRALQAVTKNCMLRTQLLFTLSIDFTFFQGIL